MAVCPAASGAFSDASRRSGESIDDGRKDGRRLANSVDFCRSTMDKYQRNVESRPLRRPNVAAATGNVTPPSSLEGLGAPFGAMRHPVLSSRAGVRLDSRIRRTPSAGTMNTADAKGGALNRNGSAPPTAQSGRPVPPAGRPDNLAQAETLAAGRRPTIGRTTRRGDGLSFCAPSSTIPRRAVGLPRSGLSRPAARRSDSAGRIA